jgi:hypothetical protein
MQANPAQERPSRRHRRLRWLLIAAIVAGALTITAELVARYYLGLGDPPLSVADPEIEYLFKPNQRCSRFGNTITYNRHSMRATPDFADRRDPAELRVMCIGDSLLNGGVLTDDSKLATTVLRDRLAADTRRETLVMNVSAGSWGPPNQLAYVRRHGLFDAEVVVLLLGSGDYADVPTFEPTVGVSPSFPDHAPALALQELVTRYVLPRLRGTPAPARNESQPDADDPDAIATALGDLAALIDLARGRGARVVVATFPTTAELAPGAGPLPGHGRIIDVAVGHGAAVLDLHETLRARRDWQSLYRDPIHPNDAGQAVIADALLPAVLGTHPALGYSGQREHLEHR